MPKNHSIFILKSSQKQWPSNGCLKRQEAAVAGQDGGASFGSRDGTNYVITFWVWLTYIIKASIYFICCMKQMVGITTY